MNIFRSLFGLTNNDRPRPTHAILLMIIFLLDHGTNKANIAVSGQAIIPFLEEGADNGGDVLRSFLEPCEAVTLQTQCTEEEYESNEDCLPQKKDNCDRSKELFCLSGVCLPNCHPHKETYDHADGKCFRKVGSDCKSLNASTKMKTKPTRLPLLLNSNEDNQGQENQQEQHSTVIVPECEKNAVCEKGQCRCAKNFTYDHNFSKCMRAANYASYCNETISCDRKSDIVCYQNQCQCKSPEIQYFHLKRKRCYVLIGQVCSTGLQFCPDNSNCVRNKATVGTLEGDNNVRESIFSSSAPPRHNGNTTSEQHKHRLRLLYEEHHGRNDISDRSDVEDEHFIGIWGDDDEEQEFVCKCERGYGSIRDKRFCLGLHGARCNTLHRCNMERGLKCVDGVCRCEKGNEQVFSEQFQTCITRVGSSCIDDGKGEREEDICPIGASCKMGKCTCDKGLTPATSSSNMASIAYSCMKSHGISCKSNSIGNNSSSAGVLPVMPQDSDLFEPPCNHEIGLECNAIEGKCLCRGGSSQFYDVRMKKCQIFQSTDVKIPVTHFTPPDDREYNFRRNFASRTATFSKSSEMLLIVLYIFSFYF